MIAKSWIAGTLFIVGLALAGSDGSWFPWINFAGIFIFGLSAWTANRFFREID